MANIKRENLLDQLYPKGQSATITLDLTAFNILLETYLAMEVEVNTAAEKARVEKALEESAKEAIPTTLAKPTKKSK